MPFRRRDACIKPAPQGSEIAHHIRVRSRMYNMAPMGHIA